MLNTKRLNQLGNITLKSIRCSIALKKMQVPIEKLLGQSLYACARDSGCVVDLERGLGICFGKNLFEILKKCQKLGLEGSSKYTITRKQILRTVHLIARVFKNFWVFFFQNISKNLGMKISRACACFIAVQILSY